MGDGPGGTCSTYKLKRTKMLILLNGIRSALEAMGAAMFEEYINIYVMGKGPPLPEEFLQKGRLPRSEFLQSEL